MALFHSKGELSLGEAIVNEGLNGEQFKGKIVETKKSGPYQGVIPEISGTAYITGLCHLIIDPDDPFKYGILRALPK
jgi:proline racemase